MAIDTYRMLINFNAPLFQVLLKYLKPGKNEKILDLGCNRGYYVKEIEKYTKEIIGIDNDEIAIREAVTGKVRFGDATNLDFDNNTFDKIYSLHVVEHIPDLAKFFSEVARVLKPGGIFIIVYPWELFRGIQAMRVAIQRYKNPLMARKIHLHKLNPKKIIKLIENTSFSHIKSEFVFTPNLSPFQYLTILKKTK